MVTKRHQTRGTVLIHYANDIASDPSVRFCGF